MDRWSEDPYGAPLEYFDDPRSNYDKDIQCPKCGELWSPDTPHHPTWVQAYCEKCGYAEGWDLYTGEGLVIRESNLEGEEL